MRMWFLLAGEEDPPANVSGPKQAAERAQKKVPLSQPSGDVGYRPVHGGQVAKCELRF
jgi:hypothetical protein